MKRWGIIALVALTLSNSGYGWFLWETAVEEPEEVVLEETQVFGSETYDKAYGYLRGGASIIGGGALVALAGAGVVSFPVASLAALLVGMGSVEVVHAYNIVDYSTPYNHEYYLHELEDTPLWEAVDKFGWQELIDRGFLTPEQMRIKFFEDTEYYPLHEIERFYSFPAIVAQGFLHESEEKMLMNFHGEFLNLQEAEQKLRENLSLKYARKVGNVLQGLGIDQPWTTEDFIYFRITPEKASVGFSEDLKRCMEAHHLNGEVEAFNSQILAEAVEDYTRSFESWMSQVEQLDNRYLNWRQSITCY